MDTTRGPAHTPRLPLRVEGKDSGAGAWTGFVTFMVGSLVALAAFVALAGWLSSR